MSFNSLPLSIAILAGGKATRMGGVNKGLLRIAGEPMIKRVVERVYHLSDDVFIVTDRARVDSRCFGVLEDYKNLRFVEDTVKGVGPLGGLYTALLSSLYGYVFVCAVDMPFVDARLIVKMFACVEGSLVDDGVCQPRGGCEAIVPVWIEGGKKFMEPLFSIYSKDLIVELERRMDLTSSMRFPGERWYNKKDYSIHRFIEQIENCCFISISDAERDSFLNLNTFEDYDRYGVEYIGNLKA